MNLNKESNYLSIIEYSPNYFIGYTTENKVITNIFGFNTLYAILNQASILLGCGNYYVNPITKTYLNFWCNGDNNSIKTLTKKEYENFYDNSNLLLDLMNKEGYSYSEEGDKKVFLIKHGGGVNSFTTAYTVVDGRIGNVFGCNDLRLALSITKAFQDKGFTLQDSVRVVWDGWIGGK